MMPVENTERPEASPTASTAIGSAKTGRFFINNAAPPYRRKAQALRSHAS